MKHRAITCFAFAGIASGAVAQNFSLSIVASKSTIGPTGSFTLSVYGNADVGTHMLGGSFGLTSDSSVIDSMSWTPAAWTVFNTDNGYAGDGNYNDVIFGQLVIPNVPPFDQPTPGSELGSLIGHFTVVLNSFGEAILDFQLNAGSPFTLEVIDIDTGVVTNNTQGTLFLGSTRVIYVPGPGAAPFIGCLGLLAARRRR